MRNERGTELFLSFLIGGLISAGIALLAAPLSGRETRSRIKHFTGGAKDTATKYVEDAKSKVTSTVEKVRNFCKGKSPHYQYNVDFVKNCEEVI